MGPLSFFCFLAPFVFCWGLRPVLGRVFLLEKVFCWVFFDLFDCIFHDESLPLIEGRVCAE